MDRTKQLEKFAIDMAGYLEIAQANDLTIQDVVEKWNEKLDKFVDEKALLKVREVV